MTFSLRCLLLAAVFLNSGCLGPDMSPADREFLRLPTERQRETITTYDLDKQVDLYLLTMFTQRPPDLALADFVARSGAKLVPVLTERLREEKDDLAKMFLIDVFYRMQSLGSYSVAADKQTMDFLEERLTSFTEVEWKRRATDLVRKIQGAN